MVAVVEILVSHLGSFIRHGYRRKDYIKVDRKDMLCDDEDCTEVALRRRARVNTILNLDFRKRWRIS